MTALRYKGDPPMVAIVEARIWWANERRKMMRRYFVLAMVVGFALGVCLGVTEAWMRGGAR